MKSANVNEHVVVAERKLDLGMLIKFFYLVCGRRAECGKERGDNGVWWGWNYVWCGELV